MAEGAVIDNLVIKITADSKSAESAISKLVSKLSQLKGSTSGSTSSISNLNSKLNSLKTTADSVKSDNLKTFSSTVSKSMDTSSIKACTNALKELNQESANLSTKSTKSFDFGSTKLNTSGKLFSSFSDQSTTKTISTNDTAAAESLKNSMSSIQVSAQSTGRNFSSWKDSLSSAWSKAQSVASTISAVYSTAKRVASTFISIAQIGFSKLKSAVTAVGSSIKSAFSSSLIGQFTSKLTTMISSLKRIAMYRLFRTMIKGITNAFKTGVNDMYQYSKTFSGTFSKNMDKISSAALTYKNSLGAMVAPLINTVTPFLEKVFYKLTDINNSLAELFAGLAGKKTYSKAVKVTKEYASAEDDASKSTEKLKDKTEELKRSFAGLDEITVIGEQVKDNTSNTSSKSTGDNGTDYSTMFEEAPVRIAGLTDDLMNSINGIDWSGLGSFFAEKINGLLDKVNWSAIQKKAKDIATRIYTFINGFVKDLDWYKLGQTLSEGIKTALLFFVTYIEGVDWSALGSGIGKMINGLASVENAKLLARALVGWISRGLEFLTGLISTIDWKKVSDTIIAFISTFDFGKISTLAVNLLNALATALRTIDWSGIGKAFVDGLSKIDWRGIWDGIVDVAAAALQGLGNLFGIDIDTSELEKTLKGLKEPVAQLLSSFSKLADQVLPVITNELLPAIVTAIGNIMTALSPIVESVAPILSKVISAVSKIIQKLSPVLTVIGTTISKIFDVLSPLIDKVLDLIVKVVDKLAPVLSDLFEIIGDIVEAASPFIDTIIETLGPVWELLSGILDILGGVLKVIKGVFNNDDAEIMEGAQMICDGVVALVKGVFLTLVDAITLPFRFAWNAIQTAWNTVKDWFDEHVIQPISKFFTDLWDGIKSVWNSVANWFNEKVVQPIKNFFTGLWDGVSKVASNAWNIISAVWIKVSGWFNTNVIQPVTNFFRGIWTSVSGFFTNLWNDIKSVWSTVSNWFNTNVIQPVSGFFSGLWNGIKSVWEKVSGWFDTHVISPVRNAFKTVTDKISGFFSNLWSGIKNAAASAINWVISKIEGGINGIISGINWFIQKFNSIGEWASNVTGITFYYVQEIQPVSLGRVSFAKGGFPEDGLFFANSNELVGQFSNGRTAVANNEQIIEGIAEGVESANEEQNRLLREQNNLLRALLSKDNTINVSSITNAYIRQNQRNGVATVPIGTV